MLASRLEMAVWLFTCPILASLNLFLVAKIKKLVHSITKNYINMKQTKLLKEYI